MVTPNRLRADKDHSTSIRPYVPKKDLEQPQVVEKSAVNTGNLGDVHDDSSPEF